MKDYYVYILANCKNGTLYIGVTRDLQRRIFEHRTGCVIGFTRKYRIHRLVHFEKHRSIREAISREKKLKKWNRRWKIRLIEKDNPEWRDLSGKIGI